MSFPWKARVTPLPRVRGHQSACCSIDTLVQKHPCENTDTVQYHTHKRGVVAAEKESLFENAVVAIPRSSYRRSANYWSPLVSSLAPPSTTLLAFSLKLPYNSSEGLLNFIFSLISVHPTSLHIFLRLVQLPVLCPATVTRTRATHGPSRIPQKRRPSQSQWYTIE